MSYINRNFDGMSEGYIKGWNAVEGEMKRGKGGGRKGKD